MDLCLHCIFPSKNFAVRLKKKISSGATPQEAACPHPLGANSRITAILTVALPLPIGGKKGNSHSCAHDL